MAIELFMMHEGFNTDVIKRGECFYLHIEEPMANKPQDRVFKGNILITSSDDREFVFASTCDKPGYNTLIDYMSVKSGITVIKEMRKLE